MPKTRAGDMPTRKPKKVLTTNHTKDPNGKNIRTQELKGSAKHLEHPKDVKRNNLTAAFLHVWFLLS